MLPRTLGFAPLLLALSATGCTTEYGGNVPQNECKRVSDDPTPGVEGRVEFVWGQGLFTCLFGCTGDNPLVSAGTAQLALVSHAGITDFTVESSDPSVLEVAHGGGDLMTVLGKAPGDVEIQILSAQGDVLDALPIRVRDVFEALTYDDLRVFQNADAVIRLELYDDEGCRMVGTGAIEYALAGGLTVENLDLSPPNPPELNDSFEQLAVRGGTPSRGGLTVTGPGVSDELELRILGPGDVDRIQLIDEHLSTVGSTGFVYPRAYDEGDDEIIGAICEWSIDPADSPIQVEPQGDSVKLTSDVAAEAIVTCTIGSAQADMRVVYD